MATPVDTAIGLQPRRPSDAHRLGPWQVRGRLGEGGMGVVYLGSRGSELAAVKTVHPQLLDDPTFRQRFQREANAVRSVRSPRVAVLVDADLAADPAYLAFHYVPGPTLAAYVQQHGPLSGDMLIAFAAGLASALAAIHGAGVTHRDIKPTNVICTEEGPIVIDFGVASVAEATSLTSTGLTIGSVGWMAPEQADGRRVGPPADVFSWAATVAFAASGQPVFGTGRPEAVIYRIIHSEPDLPDALPGPLEGLVRRALAKAPEDRPSVADALILSKHRDCQIIGATGVA